MRDFPPIHPGEILLEEFLKPMGISQYRLAKDINVPAMRINKICKNNAGISADTALLISPLFRDLRRVCMRLKAITTRNASKWIWVTGLRKRSRYWSEWLRVVPLAQLGDSYYCDVNIG